MKRRATLLLHQAARLADASTLDGGGDQQFARQCEVKRLRDEKRSRFHKARDT